jgi:hypothetical protein
MHAYAPQVGAFELRPGGLVWGLLDMPNRT